MKINIKPKIEATDQYNLRMPVTLKKRLETLKTRADDLGADFNATLVGMIEEFATELEARFHAQDQSVSTSPSTNPRTNPNKVLGRPASATASSPTAADSDSIPDPVTANGSQPERSSK